MGTDRVVRLVGVGRRRQVADRNRRVIETGDTNGHTLVITIRQRRIVIIGHMERDRVQHLISRVQRVEVGMLRLDGMAVDILAAVGDIAHAIAREGVTSGGHVAVGRRGRARLPPQAVGVVPVPAIFDDRLIRVGGVEGA